MLGYAPKYDISRKEAENDAGREYRQTEFRALDGAGQIRIRSVHMILAGDLGGTKCTLILFEVEGQRLRSVYRLNALTAEFSNVETFFDSFRERAGNAGYRLKDGDLASAGFGVAGAIV